MFMLRLHGGGGGASKAAIGQEEAPTPESAAAAARLKRATTEWPDMDPELTTALGAMPPNDVAALMFKALDANADGKVTLAELEAYLLSRDAWLKKEDVAALFSALDTAGDGGITLANLHAGFDATATGKPPLLWLMALKPPPSGVSIFKELVRSGGPIDIPDAAHRAISLGQLKVTLVHAQTRCENEQWLGKRFPDGKMRVEKLEPKAINLYDIATHIILPATHGHRLPDGTTKPAFVELLADGPQRPDYFVSHYCTRRPVSKPRPPLGCRAAVPQCLTPVADP